MTIKTRLNELMRLARHDATLADKPGKATTVGHRTDALQESSAQNAILLDCADLASQISTPSCKSHQLTRSRAGLTALCSPSGWHRSLAIGRMRSRRQ